jgi:hypothetical protein
MEAALRSTWIRQRRSHETTRRLEVQITDVDFNWRSSTIGSRPNSECLPMSNLLVIGKGVLPLPQIIEDTGLNIAPSGALFLTIYWLFDYN